MGGMTDRNNANLIIISQKSTKLVGLLSTLAKSHMIPNPSVNIIHLFGHRTDGNCNANQSKCKIVASIWCIQLRGEVTNFSPASTYIASYAGFHA